jgi:hypothetical protein
VYRRAGAVLALALIAAACSGGASSDPSTTGAPTTAPVAVACDRVGGLFPVATARDDVSCVEWLDLSMGRAVKGSTGSASVWSRNTEHGTALVVGAVHTLGEGWFGPAGTPIAAAITDPADQIGVPRLFLMLPDGSGPDALASPLFGLYHPAVAAERNGNRMQDVLPAEDFYVGVADSQKISYDGPVATPEPVVLAPVPLYDPGGVTTSAPTWAAAVPGDLVLLLGFPNATGELTASIGRVLGDDEAADAVSRLADLGDVEGTIPYDAGVEIILEAAAAPGMSGGPVVDESGRMIGVMVRASDTHDGTQYVRAVRMSHITAELAAAVAALPQDARRAVASFLEN